MEEDVDEPDSTDGDGDDDGNGTADGIEGVDVFYLPSCASFMNLEMASLQALSP